MRCWYKNSFAQAFDQMSNVANGLVLVSKRLVKAENLEEASVQIFSLI